MFLSSALPSMLLLPVAFCTPIHKHGCDLNIEGGEGANVILCYNICDRDCRSRSRFPSSFSRIPSSFTPRIKRFTERSKTTVLRQFHQSCCVTVERLTRQLLTFEENKPFVRFIPGRNAALFKLFQNFADFKSIRRNLLLKGFVHVQSLLANNV